MTLRDRIINWQKRFRELPQVWGVKVNGEETGNLYDSKNAAQHEVAWYIARGKSVLKFS